MEIAQIS